MTDTAVAAPAAGPIRHPDGIYFDLPEDDYHNDNALGSSTLKELVIDPIEYQHRKLHGGERRETIELKWGSAIHCRALEGRASFKERFPIKPAISDYPKVLDTMVDLRKWCDENGIKAAASKADTIKRIREVDKEVLIWDELIASFEMENLGKTIIPRDAIDHIERAVQWMQRDRKIAPVMEDGTFVAGASEVSIFYTDPITGIRLKARIDHLLVEGAVDLKSFRPIMAERLLPAAKRAVGKMRYDLQFAAYMRALRAAAKLYAEGKVFGWKDHFDPDFLNAVFKSIESGKFKWIWVMIKAAGAPQPVVAELLQKSMIAKTAATEIENAITRYAQYRDAFGLDADWVPDNPAETWGDDDFAPWAFN